MMRLTLPVQSQGSSGSGTDSVEDVGPLAHARAYNNVRGSVNSIYSSAAFSSRLWIT